MASMVTTDQAVEAALAVCFLARLCSRPGLLACLLEAAAAGLQPVAVMAAMVVTPPSLA